MRFGPGHSSYRWNAGTRGVMKPNRGSFGQGINAPGKPASAGRHVLNGGIPRAARSWSKWPTRHRMPARCAPHTDGREWKRNAESGSWRPRRLVNWEAVHGPAPKGCIVRRLLPICDCESNLVLVTRSVNARLNQGTWVRPAKPWRSLPMDHDIRLAAVMAAVAQVVSTERRCNAMTDTEENRRRA